MKNKLYATLIYLIFLAASASLVQAALAPFGEKNGPKERSNSGAGLGLRLENDHREKTLFPALPLLDVSPAHISLPSLPPQDQTKKDLAEKEKKRQKKAKYKAKLKAKIKEEKEAQTLAKTEEETDNFLKNFDIEPPSLTPEQKSKYRTTKRRAQKKLSSAQSTHFSNPRPVPTEPDPNGQYLIKMNQEAAKEIAKSKNPNLPLPDFNDPKVFASLIDFIEPLAKQTGQSKEVLYKRWINEEWIEKLSKIRTTVVEKHEKDTIPTQLTHSSDQDLPSPPVLSPAFFDHREKIEKAQIALIRKKQKQLQEKQQLQQLRQQKDRQNQLHTQEQRRLQQKKTEQEKIEKSTKLAIALQNVQNNHDNENYFEILMRLYNTGYRFTGEHTPLQDVFDKIMDAKKLSYRASTKALAKRPGFALADGPTTRESKSHQSKRGKGQRSAAPQTRKTPSSASTTPKPKKAEPKVLHPQRVLELQPVPDMPLAERNLWSRNVEQLALSVSAHSPLIPEPKAPGQDEAKEAAEFGEPENPLVSGSYLIRHGNEFLEVDDHADKHIWNKKLNTKKIIDPKDIDENGCFEFEGISYYDPKLTKEEIKEGVAYAIEHGTPHSAEDGDTVIKGSFVTKYGDRINVRAVKKKRDSDQGNSKLQTHYPILKKAFKKDMKKAQQKRKGQQHSHSQFSRALQAQTPMTPQPIPNNELQCQLFEPQKVIGAQENQKTQNKAREQYIGTLLGLPSHPNNAEKQQEQQLSAAQEEERQDRLLLAAKRMAGLEQQQEQEEPLLGTEPKQKIRSLHSLLSLKPQRWKPQTFRPAQQRSRSSSSEKVLTPPLAPPQPPSPFEESAWQDPLPVFPQEEDPSLPWIRGVGPQGNLPPDSWA